MIISQELYDYNTFITTYTVFLFDQRPPSNKRHIIMRHLFE